jgi:hypothetical protein
MTVLHATEPATVYLSLFARINGLKVEHVDAALYDTRTLVKQLAMRRTLFVFPRDLLPATWGSASARVGAQLAPRLAKEVEAAGLASDGTAWLAAARTAILARLNDGTGWSAQRVREEIDEVTGRVEVSPGKAYGGSFPIAPRVLTQLGVEGHIVRGVNGGHWRVSRPQWTTMQDWLGTAAEPSSAREGYAELVRRWLRSFGPGTTEDLTWWLGSTRAAVKQALADVGAVAVSLDGGQTGWVSADDLQPVEPPAPWAALLPVLDPTVMGWKERGFYLGDHAPTIFDRNGNAGTTAWWEGRVVGAWIQAPDGEVRVALAERVGAEARGALDSEAARLTDWLDGVRVGSVYGSPLMKQALT